MPAAARLSDMHTCPMVSPGPVPHVGGAVGSGSPDVIVGYAPAARVDDIAACGPAVDTIAQGAATVLINKRPAARLGDATAHGGVIVAGCPTVIIGDTGQGVTLTAAAARGTPFGEECDLPRRRARRAAARQPEAPPDAVTSFEPPPLPAPRRVERAAARRGSGAAQVQAREKLAWDFFARHAPQMMPFEVESRVRCIDLRRPVELVEGGLRCVLAGGGAVLLEPPVAAMASAPICSRASFQEALRQARRLTEASPSPCAAGVAAQLAQMAAATAGGRVPGATVRLGTSLGPIAVRELAEPSRELAALLLALEYAFRRYEALRDR